MDREKAADLLDNLIGMVEDNHGADYDTALKIGIEALSTSGDIIYRQAAIDLLKQMRKDGDMIPWEGKDVFARIRKLPSAQPEQQWIPCSERLPEEGIVLVTYRDRDIDILRYPTAYRQYDIIAWMPIEPWRGEEHETSGHIQGT